MADRPADRRSVQDFVRNVINAVTNLQTRSNQRENNEESSRAEFESRAILFNGQEGVLEGEQETLHQLQEANNQTSCIN